MAAYDGSIRIDTKIDQKGAKKGLGDLTGSLKKFAMMAGLAFGIAAVVNFGKASVKAANELKNAMIGLKSIADGNGKSFSQAKKFIEAYTADGLVPATNAVTAYKNLLMRGYDTTQIEDIMNRLKDSASFGRQASYTMGEAISGATEGLKNENSILVDNAGVTKNVAKMWEDYAKSIGTTVNNLTKQQKLQAEYLGIMEETRFQVGDAEKLTKTYSGQLAILAFSFNNLKVAFGNALLPILQAVLPYINSIVNGLTIMANKFAEITQGLFGKAEVQQNAEDATDAVNDLTDAVTGSGDAAEKTAKGLAEFDTLNRLKLGTELSAPGATPTNPDGTPDSNEIKETETAIAGVAKNIIDFLKQVKEDFVPVFGKAVTAVQDFVKALEPVKDFVAQGLVDFYNSFLKPLGQWTIGEAFPRLMQILKDVADSINWTKINDSLKGLWQAIEPFAETVGDGLLWFVENVLAPIGEWVGNELLPAFLDLLAAAIGAANTVIEALRPGAEWLFENFLKPIAEWTGGVIISVINWLTQAFTDFSNWASENKEIVEEMGKVIISILAGLVTYLVVQKIAGFIQALAASFMGLTGAINPAAIAFTLLAGGIMYLAMSWDKLTPAQRAITILTALAAAAAAAAIAIALFHTSWTMGLAAAGIVAGIALLATTYLFTSGAKAPSTGGSSYNAAQAFAGQNFSASPLPHLAQGAVLPPNRPFMAVVGDQRRGTNVEAPLDLIKQGLAEVLGGMDIGGGETKVSIHFDGPLAQLGYVLQPLMNVETIRRGKQLVKGMR
jgi:hypothetical protein